MKEHVAEIVAAYVGKNRVAAAELPTLIASVSQAFGSLGQATTADLLCRWYQPSPSVAALGPMRLRALDCGKKAKMLKRHLSTAHGLTAKEYRRPWGLPADYPVVARNYAARPSDLAKSAGLGLRGRVDR